MPRLFRTVWIRFGTPLPVAHYEDRLPGEQTFGMAVSSSQLIIVSRRAHRRVYLHSVEVNRHWFLDNQLIRLTGSTTV